MNKSTLVICSLMLVTGFAQAQSVSEALTNCSNESDSLKRLVCYDRLAEGLKPGAEQALPQEAMVTRPVLKAKTAAKAHTPATPARPEVAKKTKIAADNFGMEHKTKIENAKEKIYAKLTSVKKGPYKNLLLTLDNGQRWKQTDSGSMRLKVGEQIYVERGSLGSFFLSKEGVNRRLRVKRIK